MGVSDVIRGAFSHFERYIELVNVVILLIMICGTQVSLKQINDSGLNICSTVFDWQNF